METENKDLDSVVHRRPDKTSGAGLNDEVKVVGFAKDSDLTVLNSLAKSQKSPDIER